MDRALPGYYFGEPSWSQLATVGDFFIKTNTCYRSYQEPLLQGRKDHYRTHVLSLDSR
jgi:hypothetical protein